MRKIFIFIAISFHISPSSRKNLKILILKSVVVMMVGRVKF